MGEIVAAHLVASPFFGGPERQMLGLASHLDADFRTVFLCFAEHGKAEPFIQQAQQRGFETVRLEKNTPHLRAAGAEVADHLARLRADLLLCHGYKPDLVGLLAARKAKTPIVSVSRGWTAATFKVRMYEALDRLALRWMHRVVCVSEGQAAKVRKAGVRPEKVVVIRNAIDASRFAEPDPRARAELARLFPAQPGLIVASAGRLSPEKGFTVLVEAAAQVVRAESSLGFVLFGDGPLRQQLEERIKGLNLADRFILAGFRGDLDRLLPAADTVVLPSFTEGLPNVALEAAAAGIPVVATAVGGTPEIVRDGVNGLLVPSGSADRLAAGILALARDPDRRAALGRGGRELVRNEFTFAAQAKLYENLFEELCRPRSTPRP